MTSTKRHVITGEGWFDSQVCIPFNNVVEGKEPRHVHHHFESQKEFDATEERQDGFPQKYIEHERQADNRLKKHDG
ncbi:hypothetical protein, partial [Klebsiella pneumoniae]|uniref:hypothetical protein n=1 Tax=Klebsiella pneumoniae TaxID=573 RepID=UPI0025A05761